MEPSETAREGACDSYPFPEPTRPPASGEELFQSSGHAVRRGWLVGQWDSVPIHFEDDEDFMPGGVLTGRVVTGEPANTFYIATKDCKLNGSRGLAGTSHRLASSVTLSRDSAHGQENYHLRMLLKSWSQGTVDRFEEIGGPLYRFNQDENPLPFDLWIEGQNCSSGSFDYLSELWEFLVYVGKWH